MTDQPYIVKATNKATGEIIELPATNPQEVVEAWRVVQEYEKAAASLKDQLKRIVPSMIDTKGYSEQYGSYAFHVYPVQRMTYDKAIMRDVFDADTFDVMLKPDKTAVDKYLKENLAVLGEKSTQLRITMIPDGNPYQIIKLEKVSRDD